MYGFPYARGNNGIMVPS